MAENKVQISFGAKTTVSDQFGTKTAIRQEINASTGDVTTTLTFSQALYFLMWCQAEAFAPEFSD